VRLARLIFVGVNIAWFFLFEDAPSDADAL
jgi:hypothetical protein